MNDKNAKNPLKENPEKLLDLLKLKIGDQSDIGATPSKALRKAWTKAWNKKNKLIATLQKDLPELVLRELKGSASTPSDVIEGLQARIPWTKFVAEGEILAILQDLEKKGFLESDWLEREQHHVKIYRLTDQGMKKCRQLGLEAASEKSRSSAEYGTAIRPSELNG